jgi:hypothetical protein
MPFIVRNGSNTTPFSLQDQYLDLILAADEHVDLEQVFPEDSLYMSSVSPNALWSAIQSGDIVRRNDADSADIAAVNAFDDAIWRWSPTRQQKEALVGQPLSPSSINKYLTQGVFSLKAKVTGTARYGDLVLLEGTNITLTDDGAGNFTIAASAVIPFASPVTLVPDGGNVEGTNTSAARADHKHDLPAASAISITTTNAEGTSTSVARADHLHQGIHSLKAKVTGTARYGDLIFLEGSNITITDDGVGNFTIAAASISYATPSTLIPDGGNIEGTNTSVARSDHKHDLPAATAVSITTTNAEGTSTSIARADHLHQGIHSVKATAGGTARYGDLVFLAGTNVSISDDGAGNFTFASSESYASPVTLTPDSGNIEGTNTSVARSDHKHDLPAATAVSISTSNAEGTSTSIARADHLHQGIHSLKANAGGTARYGDVILAQGTNVTITDDGLGTFTITAASLSYASPVTLVPDGGNVEGTNTSVARSDHKHDLPAAVAVTLTPDGGNAEGTSTSVARSDHRHDLPAATAVSITTANAEGTSTSIARADHTHQGIHSLKVNAGGTARYGDLVFLGGSNITLTDDGVGNFTIAAASISYATPSTLVPDGGNVEGTNTTVARSDHKHDLPAATAVSISTSNAEGTSTSIARADHLHQGIHSLKANAGGTARYGDLVFLGGSNITLTDDGVGNFTIAAASISYATPSTLVPDGGNVEGTNTSVARSDHKHDLPAAVVSSQSPDQTNAEGTSTSVARADHIHNIATATAVSVGTANDQGSSTTSFAKADHVHQGIHSLKANAGGTARYGDLVFLAGSNVSISDDGSGNFTIGSSSSYAAPSTLTPDGGNVEGTNTTVARSDHKHNIVADPAVSVTTANAEGTSTSIARADHTHRGISSLKATAGGTARYGDIVFLAGTNVSISDDGAGNFTIGSSESYAAPSTLVPDGGNVEGTNTSVARSDHRHDLPAAAPITNLSPATTNAEGTTTSVARADHTHAIATSLTAVITTIQPDDAAAQGTQDSFARGDHRHAIAAAAPTSSLSATTTNAEGTSTSFSRADHSHAVLTGVPSTQNPDQSNAIGTSANLARADHIHNIPCDTPVALGSANTEGTSTSFARADHVHAGGTFLTSNVKAGVVASGSFAGSPKKATVTFTTAFASTAYSITITGIDARTWSYESKTTSGFTINANANAALTNEVSWKAAASGS